MLDLKEKTNNFVKPWLPSDESQERLSVAASSSKGAVLKHVFSRKSYKPDQCPAVDYTPSNLRSNPPTAITFKKQSVSATKYAKETLSNNFCHSFSQPSNTPATLSTHHVAQCTSLESHKFPLLSQFYSQNASKFPSYHYQDDIDKLVYMMKYMCVISSN
ncbi:hypothetical protein GWI33_009471 [Rhynchophorus ferrugineus]|uniref:Uncharacterized protein n=1 Tax=Rhynchophorus ferrugineus TaxID=354439 RepID=A0A834M9S7_RHYFE|nr:hypothetical protein GWI33_009471 [Rhynchophorus ferrugineus]